MDLRVLNYLLDQSNFNFVHLFTFFNCLIFVKTHQTDVYHLVNPRSSIKANSF
jgi:hypothetical protein